MNSSVSIKNKLMLFALASSFAAFSLPAHAGNEKELAQIREDIKQMRASYENRMQELEARLAKAQQQNEQLQAKLEGKVEKLSSTQAQNAATVEKLAAASAAPVAVAKTSMPNAFNPAIALNLSATYANLSKDPSTYLIQGFMPTGGEIGPGARSFSLGESELTLSANVDPHFAGQLTFALAPEGGAEVEEAFIETRDLANGLKVKAGRMLSGIGYLNSHHAHTWDFVDAPLAYQAFFGGQYKRDGVQLKWLAPLDRYVEFGLELGNGGSFPGNDRNKNGFGDSAAYVHIGDDIGSNASWRVGAAYQRNAAKERSYEDTDGISGATVANSFDGTARTVVLDGVFKWAPNGNASKTSLKLMGEYFRSTSSGELSYAAPEQALQSAAYNSRQSGWYAQGVYQFAAQWRFGLRHERLDAGTHNIGLVNNGSLTSESFPLLASYKPRKTSLMLDYKPSEFSRVRLQFARDESSPGRVDNQIYLQYNMSLGAHAGHNF